MRNTERFEQFTIPTSISDRLQSHFGCYLKDLYCVCHGYGPTFRRHDATDIKPFSCENQLSDRSHTRCRILRAVRLAARRWKTVVDWNNGGLSHAPASWSTDTSAFYHRTTCTNSRYLTYVVTCTSWLTKLNVGHGMAPLFMCVRWLLGRA